MTQSERIKRMVEHLHRRPSDVEAARALAKTMAWDIGPSTARAIYFSLIGHLPAARPGWRRYMDSGQYQEDIFVEAGRGNVDLGDLETIGVDAIPDPILN